MNKNIEVSTGKLEGNQVKIEITVPAKEVSNYIAAAYKDAAHKYRIPGFRPGKAPRKVLDSALGAETMYAQATDKLMNESYVAALELEDIQVLSEPKFDTPELVKEGIDYRFSATLETVPVFEISSLDPVEIELPSVEVTAEEITQQVDVLRGYYCSFEDVTDRAAEADDMLTIDMSTKKGDELVEELTAEGRVYQMGQNWLPAAFEENILGMAIGESKSFTFDYPQEGETVTCDVTLKTIRKRIMPDLDEEFAKKVGFSSLEEFDTAVRDSLSMQKKEALPRLKEEACLAKLAERLDGEPSEAFINDMLQELAQRFWSNLQRQGMTLDAYLEQVGITSEQFQNDLKAQATDISKQRLALDAIVRAQGIEATAEDVDAEFVAAGVEDPAALRKEWEESGRLSEIRAAVRRNKATDWLIDSAIVTELAGGEEAAKAEEKPAKKKAAKKSTKKDAAKEEKADEAVAEEEKPAKKKASKKKETAE